MRKIVFDFYVWKIFLPDCQPLKEKMTKVASFVSIKFKESIA
jgi:hypothetical protein